MKFLTLALAALLAVAPEVEAKRAPVETAIKEMAKKIDDGAAATELSVYYNSYTHSTYNYYYGSYFTYGYHPSSYSYSYYSPSYYSYSYSYYSPSYYSYSYYSPSYYSYNYSYSYSYGYYLANKDQASEVELAGAPAVEMETSPENSFATMGMLSAAILGSAIYLGSKCRKSKDSFKQMRSANVDVQFMSAP